MIARVMKREENLKREQNFSRMIARVMKRGDQGNKTMILRNILFVFYIFFPRFHSLQKRPLIDKFSRQK